MPKRFFPDTNKRAAVEAALDRYLKQEGNFALIDEAADERTVWTKTYLDKVSPWGWWDKALLGSADEGEEDLIWCAKRVLQLGVSSPINERIFSHWENIILSRTLAPGRKSVNMVDWKYKWFFPVRLDHRAHLPATSYLGAALAAP